MYNIVFNHALAMIVKPNGPKDLRKVENLRELYKRRAGRKSLEYYLDKDTDDRFDGVSKDVKKLLRYRHKTMNDLSFIDKRCTHCDDVKPARTHHCSVCN